MPTAFTKVIAAQVESAQSQMADMRIVQRAVSPANSTALPMPAALPREGAAQVESARTQSIGSRSVQRAGDLPTAQTSSKETTSTESESADSSSGTEVHAERQMKGRSADQATAAGSDATAKGAQKASVEGDPEPVPAVANASSIPDPVSATDEASRLTAGVTARSGFSSLNTPAMPDGPVVSDQPPVPTAPMRDIAVRVESAEGQNVDVRIVQRANDLQIAVTSADADTTQGLRHGLSELTTRLNESGYHAETWSPGHTAATSETAAESGNSSHQPPQGDSQSNSGWSQQNRGQRENNQSNRPRWMQEFESNLAGGTESTGQLNGFIS
jgi:hypothetical protein